MSEERTVAGLAYAVLGHMRDGCKSSPRKVSQEIRFVDSRQFGNYKVFLDGTITGAGVSYTDILVRGLHTGMVVLDYDLGIGETRKYSHGPWVWEFVKRIEE